MRTNLSKLDFLFYVLLLSLISSSANAATWTLDNNASQLNFVSIKAGNVAEGHTFEEMQGHINESGAIELSIVLDSVNTAIDIRNERMRKLLFDTAKYARAGVKSTIDPNLINNLTPGQTTITTVKSGLDLAGKQSEITADLQVFKLNENTLVVSTHKPILLNAEQLGLEAGIEKLREIAGLPSISLAVPVNFTLVFTTH